MVLYFAVVPRKAEDWTQGFSSSQSWGPKVAVHIRKLSSMLDSMVPVGSYRVPSFRYPILAIGICNHKVRYPKRSGMV